MSDSQATRRSGSLAGRTVVVIGGTSGIGEATALSAAASGALVYVAGRDAARVASCVEGHEALEGGFAVDIADPAAVGDLFRASGVVDHVVVTAGDVLTGRAKDIDLGAARLHMDVRFWGVLHVAQAARFRRDGSLTVVTGTAHWRPRRDVAVAMAIVGAAEALARALAVDLAPVRVNSVAPGTVRTPRTIKTQGSVEAADEYVQLRAAALPAGRIGRPEDIASLIWAIALNPYMTGSTVHIDGGDLLV